jgi:predicted permease
MAWMISIGMGLRSLFAKRRVERELDEELDTFVEAAAADNERRGMAPEAARRAANAQMGSRNAVKHHVWSSRWESRLESLLHDLRVGVRGLAKTPGFTAVALVSLALGIGANTAIFTLLNAILLRPLPVPHPEQLYLFGDGKWVGSTDGMPDRSWQLFSYPFFKDFSAQTQSFTGVAAQSSIQMGSHISLNGGAMEHVRIDLVSGGYFNVLEVPPALGRMIAESDDRAASASPVAVASYGWFQRHFQGNPAEIGKTVNIQGRDYTIIGVAQPGFSGIAPAQPTDLWIPLSMQKEISPGWNGLTDHDFQSLYLVGRLKPGVSLAQTGAATNLLFRQIIRAQYLGGAGSSDDLVKLAKARIDLTSAAGGLPGLKLRYSAPLGILMGIVALVLLIACANIANMLLARGVARARELAVRQALGATRRRIVVQLMTESFLLAASGAALGVLLAWRGLHLLLALGSQGPEAMPLDISADFRILSFTILLTVITALLFGIVPALRISRLELAPALRDGHGGSSASARGALSRSLIVAQVALSILLLAAAGLFLRSLRNLTSVDLGFNPRNVMVFTLDEYAANLPLDARLVLLQQQIEQKVQALPGVRSASFSMFTFNQGEWSTGITVQGVPPNDVNSKDVLNNVIGTRYLETVGIPMIAGRNFNGQDTLKSPKVAIVNETLAKTFFPNQSPLGHRFCLCDPSASRGQKLDFDVEIVGVVRDAKYVGLGEHQHMAAYFPYAQRIQYFGNFSVKSTLPAASLIPAVRNIIAEVNPQIAVAQVEPLSAQVQGSIATQRLIGWLSASFAALAVFLAAIGTYGLISYSVARRTNEIGIRMALGAQTPALLWMVLRESVLLLTAGLVIGVPLALAVATGLANVLKAQLFNVSAVDPVAFVAAGAIVSAVTIAAAWIPARHAARINPLTALRCE